MIKKPCCRCCCSDKLLPWLLAVLFTVLILASAVYAYQAYLSRRFGNLETPPIPYPTETPTSSAAWQTYKNATNNFELQMPQGWQEQANYVGNVMLVAPDGSALGILITKDSKFTNLTDYLRQLDKESQTGFEGQPSTKIISSTNSTFLGQPSVERTYELLAAGFREISTYVYLNHAFWEFTAVPNAEDLYSTNAYKYYSQILSTFKFTN